MFRKALLAAAALAVTAGSIAATTGTASAGNWRYNSHNYQRIVCEPVFAWKTVWSSHHYRYITIKVKIDERCYWVSAPRYNRWSY